MKRLSAILTLAIVLLLFHGYVWAQPASNNAIRNSNASQAAAATPAAPDGDDVPWALIVPLIAAVVSGAISGLCTWSITKGSLATELKVLKTQFDQATANAKELNKERGALLSERQSA